MSPGRRSIGNSTLRAAAGLDKIAALEQFRRRSSQRRHCWSHENLRQSGLRRTSQATLLLCAPSGNHDVVAERHEEHARAVDRADDSF